MGRFRRFLRQAVTLRAAVAHPVAGWQREVRVVDVGLGGAGLDVVTLPEIGEGDRVSLSFTTPALWDPLTLSARVIWVKDGRAGVAFEHKSPSSAHALFELIASQ
jgi:hypothetical protein